jgi:hypothetical protein
MRVIRLSSLGIALAVFIVLISLFSPDDGTCKFRVLLWVSLFALSLVLNSEKNG